MSCHQRYPWNPDFYCSQSFQEDLGFVYHAPPPTGEFLNHCTFSGICYNSTPPPGTNTCICFQRCKTISNKLSNLTHINYLIVSVGQNSGHDLAESSVQGLIRPFCSSRGSTEEETTSRFTPIAVWRIVSLLCGWGPRLFAGSQFLDATHSSLSRELLQYGHLLHQAHRKSLGPAY